MRTIWTFHTASQMRFGWGAASEVGEVAIRLGLRRLLIITDSILERLGIVETLSASLRSAGIHHEQFHGGEPEPSLAAVLRALQAGHDCQPDGIIGLGGGSNMDMAKIVATCLAHGGKPTDYAGEDRIPGPILPLICVPTTSGTGSEVSSALVFTDPGAGMKVSCLSQYLRPRAALVDPALSLTCPAQVTADSGIDALVHAIEAFTAVDNAHYALPAGKTSCYQGSNPMADLAATESIRLCGQFLARAVADGTDREAREGMALAATLGGMAFSNAGVALVHALEYAVASEVHVSHGAGNGLLLPHVMRYNLPARASRFARVATLLGGDTQGLAEPDAAALAVTLVEKLTRQIGIPLRLRDLGMQPEQMARAAPRAGIERLWRVNPRRPSAGEVLEILQNAW